MSTKEKVTTWVQPHVQRADESIIGRYYERLLETEFIDRSVALAAKLFISFFPFVIAIAAFSPDTVRDSLRSALIHRMGLEGEAQVILNDAMGTAGSSKAAIGAFGLLLLLVYATSFTTALQRAYLRAWRRPGGGGWRNQRNGLAWIAGVILLTAVTGTAMRSLTGWQTVLSSIAFFILSCLMWWWTSHLMLRGEVKWRPLLPGALTNAVCLAGYVLAAPIWMPRNLESNVADFGVFGITLSLVTYFVGASFVMVMSAALSPILAEGKGKFAHWLCSGSDGPLVEGARPPLPEPSYRLSIAAAFGIPSRRGAPDNYDD